LMSYRQEIVGGYFLLVHPVHVCDTSNTHCLRDMSQVCVMSMLRVCALQYCCVVWTYRLWVSVMSVLCVSHTAHSWQTHTSGIFRQDNSQPRTHT